MNEFHTMSGGGMSQGSRDKKVDRVAIVGAGVAGCAMAAALRDQRIDFVVYDKNSKAGGLWADNYPGARGTQQSADDGSLSGVMYAMTNFCISRLSPIYFRAL
jgi:cation diffusion facilitator CzcD-associated flavoprotein CzcO